MIKEAAVYEEQWCRHCEATTVHLVYLGGTTNGLRLVVTVQCQVCKKAAGRIV